MTEQHARPMFTKVSVNDIVRLEAKTAKVAQRLKRDGDCWIVERTVMEAGPFLCIRAVVDTNSVRWIHLRTDPDFTIVEVINDVHR